MTVVAFPAPERLGNLVFVPEIETELLGAITAGDYPFPVASQRIDEHAFVEPLHGHLFRMLGEAYQAFGACTPPLVNRLTMDERIMQGFGAIEQGLTPASYLIRAVSTRVGMRGADAVTRVLEQAARFDLRHTAETLHAAVTDAQADPKRILRSVANDLDTIAARIRKGPSRPSATSASRAVLDAAAAAEEARMSDGTLTGCTWGLATIDRMTGGMQRGELTLLAARPSIGKSTVAVAALLNAALAGHGALFLSLEMPARQIGYRMASDLIHRNDRTEKVAYSRMAKGDVEAWMVDRMVEAGERIDGLPLVIEDMPKATLTETRVRIEAAIERCEAQGDTLSVVCVDHIGLMTPPEHYRGNRTNELAEITGALKAMAREYDVAMLALSQLSRAVEQRDNKRPMLSDLRDSGAIEQDADTVMFLYREAYYLSKMRCDDPDDDAHRVSKMLQCQHDMEIILAKQRMGPCGTMDVWCDMALSAVRDCDGCTMGRAL